MVCDFKTQQGQPQCKMFYEIMWNWDMMIYLLMGGAALIVFVVVLKWFLEKRFPL